MWVIRKANKAIMIAMTALILTAIFAMPILNDYLNLLEVTEIIFMLTGIGLVQYNIGALENDWISSIGDLKTKFFIRDTQ